MFTTPTYIVLDIPSPVADEVISLRRRYDAGTARLPAEITIAGSSGVGTLAPEQDSTSAFAAVRRVALKHLPIVSAFVSVERFAGAPVFWLKPRDRAPFDELQHDLVAEGLVFSPSSFPFTPHCTISATTQLSPFQESEVLSTQFPQQAFTLSRLSLYELAHGHATLLQSFGADA